MHDEFDILLPFSSKRASAGEVQKVRWSEYCALALSRRPIERFGGTRGNNGPLRDRSSGTVFVLEKDSIRAHAE